ncbi:pilus assembly protein PilM [Butyrivibrio sp. FC2001]|uniref:pilus assembly protein PilM n=1 Tax=Butyrivibrio sp. FC2001 TaxID=1280671 RepID=UPI00040EF896|nr:pilus assembly protein PilM [Butyrivibrio sp. FC2001]
MARNDGVLGLSVTHEILSLTLMKGGVIRKTVWEEFPDNIVEEGKIVSQNLFAEFLKEQLKEKKINCKNVAYVISDTDIFVRNISMPKIDEEQIRFNIPFEFKDLIQGELKQYVYDYVERRTVNDEGSNTIKLLAYAVPLGVITEIRETLKLAGLKLVKALPETSVYETLLGAIGNEEEILKERCFMDISQKTIRMMIFKNGEFKVSHMIDIGEDRVIDAIADEFNVDRHLAVTYLRSKYKDCDQVPGAINAYKDISIEIMKGINYYEMSDMTSRLKDIVLCGMGAMTEPLVEMLKQRLDKNVVTLDELYPKFKKDKDISVTFGSVGILLSDAVGAATNGDMAVAGEKRKVKTSSVLIAAAAILVALCIGAKFGVIDRMNILKAEREKAALLQEEITAQTKLIVDAESAMEDYYHYSWDMLSDEEKGRVDRLEAAKLADLIGQQGMKIKFMDLAGETLTVDLLAKNLDSVSQLSRLLSQQDIVESCAVTSAKTIEEALREDIGAGDNNVNAQIKIYLITDSSKEGNEQ